MGLTIWTNALLSEAAHRRLEMGLAGHRLVISQQASASVLSAGEMDPDALEAEVLWGQPDPEVCRQSKRLKMVVLTSAGYTRYDRPEFWEEMRGRGVVFCNASSVFAEPCAQHALAFMLAMGRQLYPSHAEQLGECRWRFFEHRAGSRLLNGQTVVLLGYGAIARRLVELLAPFGMKIYALRRKSYSERGVHIVGEERLTSVLGEADHVVNLLPDSEATRNYINARRLAAMRRDAIFYNIGRGTTVDTRALVDALEAGRLGGACLDVFEEEPLPPDDVLWRTKNCFLTPHTAGGRHDQDDALVRHFLANLAGLKTGDVGFVDRVV